MPTELKGLVGAARKLQGRDPAEGFRAVLSSGGDSDQSRLPGCPALVHPRADGRLTADGEQLYQATGKAALIKDHLSGRFNSQSNQWLEFWIKFLTFHRGTPIKINFPDDDNPEAEFTLSEHECMVRATIMQPKRNQLPVYIPLGEPELLFHPDRPNDTHRHPLEGLLKYGPFSTSLREPVSDPIRIAVICPEGSFPKVRGLFGQLQVSHTPRERKNYHSNFPGFAKVFGVGIDCPWPAPQKLVQPKRETPGRLAHGGTHEKAMDRRRDYAVAEGSRPRSGQGTDRFRHLSQARHRSVHVLSLATANAIPTRSTPIAGAASWSSRWIDSRSWSLSCSWTNRCSRTLQKKSGKPRPAASRRRLLERALWDLATADLSCHGAVSFGAAIPPEPPGRRAGLESGDQTAGASPSAFRISDGFTPSCCDEGGQSTSNECGGSGLNWG